MKLCALYTRVSTAMQAEKDYGSCEAQRDKILSYVKSQEDLEVVKEYSDPGFSASNLDRPALKELLNDIAKKKIDSVLTYKIDRLTRSSKDFYSLIEFFEQHGVSYVSVTEHFDTSSPSGRLLRNIMLTFAQFEREMIADRVKNTMLQRAEKGLWNGGYMPFGYKKENGKLLINKKDAALVCEIFERFVLTGSLKQTTKFVIEKEVKNPKTGNQLTMSGVAHILRNPAYIGRMVWAGKVYEGIHEQIISKELFEHAQDLTKDKVRKKQLYKEFFIRGLIKCSDCGSMMSPTFTNKPQRRYYYYMCTKVTKEGKSACGIKEVNAEKLESFLIESLSRISDDKQYIENLAFKIAHESPRPAGVELPEESFKNLSTRVSQVLMEFKNKIQKATQVEKCLIFQKTIQGIKFYKEHLEVTVFIKDTNELAVEEFFQSQSGRLSGGAREGAVNSDAPACSSQFGIKEWCARQELNLQPSDP